MNRLLLDVWQEVGRHIELQGALEALAGILSRSASLEAIELLRIEDEGSALEIAAAFYREGATPASSRRLPLSAGETQRLLEALAREQVIAVADEAPWPAPLSGLSRLYEGRDVLLGQLTGADGRPIGVVLLVAGAGVSQARHLRLLTAILEPLSVALENDNQLRALNEQRALAEAERLALLNRLGTGRPGEVMVGANDGLKPVMLRVEQVARSDTSVLLLGETGSGKEVIARAIHDRSLRAHKPFIRVNCGAVAPELIDSELFGHEKGSFTGAAARRKGWFEQADGGTLFLDEVGELTPAAQVRLLRVLQDGSLNRIGGEETIHVDVRVIAATHRDLASMVQQGAFREDLWYRIAVFPILIPPLRERAQDIPELARHFAQKASQKIGLHLQLPTREDIALLKRYDWPGNVREMASVIERAVILGEGRRLEVAAALGLTPSARAGKTGKPGPVRERSEFATLDEAISEHIRTALARTGGRIEGPHGAARLLAVNPHTLRSRMRKLAIDPAPYRGE